MSDNSLKPALQRVVPALVHIQTHLDQDLSLDVLADEAGVSKFHFHQLFRDATGETPKSYVDRLRLEKAALQLRMQDASILAIALACGYQNHETFSRAFRAHFGVAPRDYRREWPRVREHARERALDRENLTVQTPKLSATRVTQLARISVGFIRNLGPYEHVPAAQFDRLVAWAHHRGAASETALLLGIAHDAPGLTPVEKLRFDCCIQVPEMFEPEPEIACQRTPGGTHAITDYVGGWDMKSAYRAIFERLLGNPTFKVIGLPILELYQTTRVGPHHGLAHVSIAVPIELLATTPDR